MAHLTKGVILASLPKLSRADLEQVAATATALLGGPTGAFEAPAIPLAAPVYDAISAALCLTVPLSSLPDATAKRFYKQVPMLEGFLNQACQDWNGNKLKQIAVLRTFMCMLKDDLLRIKIKPTLTTMINNLHRMPEVFDNAFPGYREAGLGSLVLKQFAGSSS